MSAILFLSCCFVVAPVQYYAKPRFHLAYGGCTRSTSGSENRAVLPKRHDNISIILSKLRSNGIYALFTREFSDTDNECVNTIQSTFHTVINRYFHEPIGVKRARFRKSENVFKEPQKSLRFQTFALVNVSQSQTVKQASKRA